MSQLKQLVTEIHRRSLWQVLLIYVGAAWACFELITTVAETMGLPGWLPGLAIVLFLLGLPFVIATALVREETVPPTREGPATEAASVVAGREAATRRRRFLTWRTAGASFVVALAVWGVVATGWMLFRGKGTDSETERKMLVVLPFENLGAPEDEYFADGLTDAINARLASLHGLGIISRQSAVQYRNSDKTAREIGAELGVEYILEGTVQRERPGDPTSRARVIPQLIRIADDTHLWAETFDEEMSEVFRVQSEIAERVAHALDVTLLASERQQLQSKPTENAEAYEYYLRGLDYYNIPGLDEENTQLAEELYPTESPGGFGCPDGSAHRMKYRPSPLAQRERCLSPISVASHISDRREHRSPMRSSVLSVFTWRAFIPITDRATSDDS